MVNTPWFRPRNGPEDVSDLIFIDATGSCLHVALDGRLTRLLVHYDAAYREDIIAGLPPSAAGWRSNQDSAKKLFIEMETIRRYRSRLNQLIRSKSQEQGFKPAPRLFETRRSGGVRLARPLSSSGNPP